MVGASVSVSGRMPFSLPCPSRVFHLSVALCLPLSVCASVCVCLCAVVCARTRVCLPLAIFESVSEPSSLSGSVFPDTGPPIPSSAPGLS